MPSHWNRLLNGEAPKADRSHQDSFLTKVLIPLAGIFVGAIGLASSKDLPWWALTVLISILCILLGVIAWPPVTWMYAMWSGRRARIRTAKSLYPELDLLFRRFQQQVGDSYTNSLTYQLRNFIGIRDASGASVIQGLAEFTSIGAWLRLLAPKIEKRQTADFEEIVRAMDVAASQYSWQCISLENRLLGALTEKSLDEATLRKLRQAWNGGREHANKVLSEWGTFSERVNRELEDHIGTVHFSSLRLMD